MDILVKKEKTIELYIVKTSMKQQLIFVQEFLVVE